VTGIILLPIHVTEEKKTSIVWKTPALRLEQGSGNDRIYRLFGVGGWSEEGVRSWSVETDKKKINVSKERHQMKAHHPHRDIANKLT
jgi:hypothetical protein